MANKKTQILNEKIFRLTKLGKPKIAFGFKEPNKEILKSLAKSKKYADITLVGSPAIKKVKGFKIIIDNNPEEKLAQMFVADKFEGIIRGTIDDFKTYEAYQKLSGEKETSNVAVLEDPFGRQFLINPASNPAGWRKEERLDMAVKQADFLRGLGVKPKIAVFTAERHETYPRRKHIRKGVIGFLNRTYEEAKWIVGQLKNKGYEAENWAIDLNPAVKAGCNVLIPVNGMVGNQIFRAIEFCGGKMVACPRLGLSRCYEDNSRTETDYEPHVKWLAAWINGRKNKKINL